MAISFIQNVGRSGTTGFAMTLPTGVAVNDIMLLAITNRQLPTPTVSGDGGGTNTWLKILNTSAATTGNGSLWWNRATSGSPSSHVFVTGCANSCIGGIAIYRGCITGQAPYTGHTAQINASADETHTYSVQPPTGSCEVVLSVFNYTNDTTNPTGNSMRATNNPSPLIQRFNLLTALGSDCDVCLGSAPQTGDAGSSTGVNPGNLLWGQANAATLSIACLLIPQPDVAPTAVAQTAVFALENMGGVFNPETLCVESLFAPANYETLNVENYQILGGTNNVLNEENLAQLSLDENIYTLENLQQLLDGNAVTNEFMSSVDDGNTVDIENLSRLEIPSQQTAATTTTAFSIFTKPNNKGSINLSSPVNIQNPLNRGITSWWLNIPDMRGGQSIKDLLNRKHAVFTQGANGTISWGIRRGRTGGFASLMHLWSSADNTTYLDIAGAPATTTTFTWCAWVRPRANGSESCWFGDAISNYVGYRGNSGGTIDVFYSAAHHESSSIVTNNAWSHVAVVADAGSITMYINGVLVGSATSWPGMTPIKMLNNNNSLFFDGNSDDIRYWVGRALSNTDIVAIYQDSLAGYPRTLNWKSKYFPVSFDVSGQEPLPGMQVSVEFLSGKLNNQILTLAYLQSLLNGQILPLEWTSEAGTVQVLSSGILSIEFLQNLIFDKLVGVAGQLGAEKVNIISLENLQQLLVGKNVNLINSASLLLNRTLSLENLFGIYSRHIYNVENLAGIINRTTFNIENLYGLVNRNIYNVETLLGILNANIFSGESLQSSLGSGKFNIETLQGILARGILNAEWTGTSQVAVSALGIFSIEILKGVIAANTANAEILKGLSSRNTLNIETLAGVQKVNLLCAEILLGLQNRNVINIETLLGLQNRSIFNVENLLGVSNINRVVIESLVGLIKNNVLNIETLRGIITNNVLNAEWGGTAQAALSASGIFSLEMLKGILTSNVVDVESLKQLRTYNQLSVETLLGIAKQNVIAIERLMGIAPRNILSIESGGVAQAAISASAILSLEILQGLSKTNSLVIDSLQRLSSFSSLDIDHFSSLLAVGQQFPVEQLKGVSFYSKMPIGALKALISRNILPIAWGDNNPPVVVSAYPAELELWVLDSQNRFWTLTLRNSIWSLNYR